ncbi:MAG: ADP-ribosylglycohydrolase family protein, partial [Saprospiraceae bacterium]
TLNQWELAGKIAFIQENNHLNKYMVHPEFPDRFKKYTDDTQMALGIAELLMGGKEWTALSIANKFVEVFHRDKRTGYAKRFYALLNEVKTGQELLDRLIPKSERNGAAMRAYPLGILKDIKEIKRKNKIQSSVTHQTEKAILSAEAIALTSHFFIQKKGNKNQLIDFLFEHQNQKWNHNHIGEVKINAIETVEAVLTILLSENSLKNMLQKSVVLGGDVDTVASLCLAIGSQMNEVENDLPNFLFDELENGNYGRDYLMQMGNKLFRPNKIKIGVVGFSRNQFDKKEAYNKLKNLIEYQVEKFGTENIEIVSGYTNSGVPKIAYEIADEFNLFKTGFSAKQALRVRSGVYKVDKEIIYGQKFGDESEAFIQYIDILIRIGGGKQSRHEKALFKSQKENLSESLFEEEVDWYGS